MNNHKTLKIIFYNCLVLLLLLLSLEIIWRLALTIKHYKNPHISYFGKTWYRFNQINLGTFDEKLQTTLIPNIFFDNFDLPRFEKNAIISSDSLGFRNNSNQVSNFRKGRILTVGDSFTFGDQTSDNSTWPSCLEKNILIKTDNGGFGGYSAGQAVRKAIIETQKRKYSHVIWSIFFQDFRRDFNKDFIIRSSDGSLVFNKFKKNKKKIFENRKSFYDILKEYSFLIYHYDIKLLKKFPESKKNSLDKKNDSLSKIYNINEQLMFENINFLITNFANLDVNKKIILYQYGDWSTNSSKAPPKNDNPDNNKIKDYINKYTKDYDILIIDSAEEFEKYSNEELRHFWFDHHTRQGNQVVCKFIIKKLIDNKYISE